MKALAVMLIAFVVGGLFAAIAGSFGRKEEANGVD